jgi:hypothetical protein
MRDAYGFSVLHRGVALVSRGRGANARPLHCREGVQQVEVGMDEEELEEPWRQAQRNYRAKEFLARQLALKAAGPLHVQYLAGNHKRLMSEAARIIARSPGLARYRPR